MPKSKKRKPNLTLVKTREVSKRDDESLREVESNNFWNTCPLKLDSLPTKPCGLGYESSKVKSNSIPSCPWWVNSKKHNYCFWRWVRDNSSEDGRMDPLLQNEIAKLFGCSSTKVHFILKEAMESLKNNEHLGVLADYAHSDVSETQGQEISLESQIPDYDSGDE